MYMPPHGASNGGEPGFFDAFPGARGGGGAGGGNPYPSSSHRAPPGPGHTPYPTQPVQLSPWTPPHSAPAATGGWPYGGYTPAGPPMWGPLQTSGPHPASPWGPPPDLAMGGGGGGASPYHPYAQWAPGGYTANVAAASAFPGAGPSHQYQHQHQHQQPQPHTPYAAPGTPFESSVGQPITGGWFGRGGAGGAGGGGAAEGGGGVWGEKTGTGWETPGWEGAGWDWHADEKRARHREKEKEKEKKRRKRQSGEDWDDWDMLGWNLDHSSPTSAMKRAHSQVPQQVRRRPSLHRSSSWGAHNAHNSPWTTPNAHVTPEYAQGDLYDENNLAKRPRDWRPDYNPRQGLLPSVMGAMGGLARRVSSVKEYHDPIRRQIHPLFDLSTLSPALALSLRVPPSSSSLSPPHLTFFRLARPHNPIDLLQLATHPPTPFMRLVHPKLPWYIDVVESRPNGVLVGDVLEQVVRQLHVSVSGRHYWNDVLGTEERREIARAFEDRVRAYGEGEARAQEERARWETERSVWGDRAEHGGGAQLGRDRVEDVVRRGILQVDFLGSKFWLEGLVRGPKGVWEMRTRAAD
ncbi:hypothetical protein CVT25_009522 [Psilocybe cyanescens]|uniref:DUF6699 domain-containing protein n=1 Tax=Psilocybe cyanescens TaxID=93625 RepID=A0A409WWR1_PSICY|nr:hypothetical protein CVT25_009522 [Psilocybe cyanescens]